MRSRAVAGSGRAPWWRARALLRLGPLGRTPTRVSIFTADELVTGELGDDEQRRLRAPVPVARTSARFEWRSGVDGGAPCRARGAVGCSRQTRARPRAGGLARAAGSPVAADGNHDERPAEGHVRSLLRSRRRRERAASGAWRQA